MRSATEKPIPERIGRYEVLLPIASGGMATVYLARARGAGGFERDVALKLTHAHLAETPELAADLLEEAKLTVLIRHANVVAVLDAGDDPYGVFLVMEYIEGDTLSGLVRRSAAAGVSLPPGVGLRILCDALTGLHAAHEQKGADGSSIGLVHRDFSPQNILIGLDGVGRLADFGVAKAFSRAGHTTTGTVKGKIAYMAPEQARGQRIDRRIDVWAAGVIAWELLSGSRLYPVDNDANTLLRIVSETPPPLRSVVPEVPVALEAAVASALVPDPGQRCPTAAQFARALTNACRASNLVLADTAEVAEVVERLAGARLAARRARVAEVGELRRRGARIAERSSEASLTPSSDGILIAPPAAPSFATRRETTPVRGDTQPFGAFTPPSGVTPPAAPRFGPPPPPVAPPLLNGVSTVETEASHTSTDTTSVSTPHGTSAARTMLRSRRPLVLAVAAAAAVGAGSMALWFGTRRAESVPPVASATIAEPQARDPESVPAVQEPTANPTATPTPTPTAFAIAANAPVASVRVGNRVVSVSPPSKKPTIERLASEIGKPLDMDVHSVDGRKATVHIAESEAATTVEFAPPPSPARDRPPPRALPKDPYRR